jgi:hypothetical protein
MFAYPIKIEEFLKGNSLYEKGQSSPITDTKIFISTSQTGSRNSNRSYNANTFEHLNTYCDSINNYVHVESLAKFGLSYNTKTGAVIYIESTTNTKNNIAFYPCNRFVANIKAFLSSHESVKGMSNNEIKDRLKMVKKDIKVLMDLDLIKCSNSVVTKQMITYEPNSPGNIQPMNYPDIMLPLKKIWMCTTCFLTFSCKELAKKHKEKYNTHDDYCLWAGQKYKGHYVPVLLSAVHSYFLNELDNLLIDKPMNSYELTSIILDAIEKKNKTDTFHLDPCFDASYFSLSQPRKHYLLKINNFCSQVKDEILKLFSGLFEITAFQDLFEEFSKSIQEDTEKYFLCEDSFHQNHWFQIHFEELTKLNDDTIHESFKIITDLSKMYVTYLIASNVIKNTTVFANMRKHQVFYDKQKSILIFSETGIIAHSSENVLAILTDSNLISIFTFIFGPLRHLFLLIGLPEARRRSIYLFLHEPICGDESALSVWSNLSLSISTLLQLSELFVENNESLSFFIGMNSEIFFNEISEDESLCKELEVADATKEIDNNSDIPIIHNADNAHNADSTCNDGTLVTSENPVTTQKKRKNSYKNHASKRKLRSNIKK